MSRFLLILPLLILPFTTGNQAFAEPLSRSTSQQAFSQTQEKKIKEITRDEIKTGVTLKERINQEVKESKEIDKLIQENVNRFFGLTMNLLNLQMVVVTVIPIAIGIFFWLLRGSILESAKKEIETQLQEGILKRIEEKASQIEKKASQAEQEINQALQEVAQLSTEASQKIQDDTDHILKLKKTAIEKIENNLSPKSFKEFYDQGLTLMSLGQYQEALTAFNKSLEIKPNDFNAWFKKFMVLEYLDNYKDALKAIEKAIEIQPDDFNAWFRKSTILERLNNYEDALKAIEKAIEIQPNSFEAYFCQGLILMNLQRLDEAKQSIENALVYGDPSSVPDDIRSSIKNLAQAIAVLSRL